MERVVTCDVGEPFVYGGRAWKLADHAGATWGEDRRGREYVRIKVWPAGGGEMRFISIYTGRVTERPCRKCATPTPSGLVSPLCRRCGE